MSRPADEWTSGEIEILRGLAAAGRSPAEIAPRLGRSEASVRAQLSLEDGRPAAPPEWNGPDEEGDVPPPTGRASDDPAAWVHSDRHDPIGSPTDRTKKD
ncbi:MULTISPECIES: hypothetical protein [unclassified Sphingomonas]|uniref:hypothetical protein n=1 Tax=unclassified Sphingomonas TaxID=196159 RepID=UPI0006FD99CC|nr:MULTISPECIES: hypothetical protein [unclassified Sphingomonas]KQX19281.1 hypothetical protein ASD17_12095 [Sphingomonas sp. Root1294]KQY65485.1 hypothetical protein ASD39_15295 [Sphingomonas sp. Root50]KRB95217.1 hypothetical protein ASE22_04765 [Sphingomonas sp. Root720]